MHFHNPLAISLSKQLPGAYEEPHIRAPENDERETDSQGNIICPAHRSSVRTENGGQPDNQQSQWRKNHSPDGNEEAGR